MNQKLKYIKERRRVREKPKRKREETVEHKEKINLKTIPVNCTLDRRLV